MILLVDIGNSRVKWACLSGGQMIAGLPAVHRGREPLTLWDMMWPSLPVPQRLLVATVSAPALSESLSAWTRTHWSLTPEFVRADGWALGVTNGYRQPETLGVDRWLALIGARQLPETCTRPICVVDCGTALTADVLTTEGEHLGGWIAPGLVLMRRQLVMEAAALAGINLPVSRGGHGFGRETGEAIMEGTRQACVGFVVQSLATAQQQLGARPALVVTGGGAEELMPSLPEGARLCPDLVLRGLAAVASQHENRSRE